MRPIHAGRTPVKHAPMKIAAAAMAALSTVLAAGPAPADDAAAASGGDVPQAHGGAPNGGAAGDGAAAKGPPAPDSTALTSRDVELAPPPRHGPPGLWRRANMGALIANTKAVGLPPPAHIAPLLRLGSTPPTPRNAINTPPPGHNHPGPGGIRTTNTVAGSVRTTNYVSAPPTAGPPPFGAAINGTGMGRMVSGSIGGPAKDHSGINGTSMRPKH